MITTDEIEARLKSAKALSAFDSRLNRQSRTPLNLGMGVFDTPIYNFKSNFFVTKSKTMRFEHKLYNALKISREEPKLIGFLGLYWKNEDTFIVNIPTFGALLGAPYPRAYLCYEAGLFAKHGFRDVTSELINTNPEELKDCNNIPYRHQSGKFNVNMTEEDLDTYCNTDLSTEEHQESK